MSAPRRGTIAGMALAAAGVFFSRFTGRRPAEPSVPPPETDEGGIPSSDAVERARSELADELARRAAGQTGSK
jgi:hypothetical protein